MEILPTEKSDLDEIVELYDRYNFALQKKEWMDWKYFKNPWGKALSFKIIKKGRIVGTASIIPQAFYYRKRKIVGLQTVDGILGEEIRGKKKFNKLMFFLAQQKIDGVTEDYFYLSFPSLPVSVKAHENAGWDRLASFQLYSCFFNANPLRKLKAFKKLLPVLKPFWLVFRKYLTARADSRIEIQEIDKFENDFKSFCNHEKVYGDRSSEFLNWRVINNPKDTIKAYKLIEQGKVIGLFICKIIERKFEVIDVKFAKPRRKYLVTFFKYLIDGNMADSIDLWILGNEEIKTLLPKFSFFRRKFNGALFVKNLKSAHLPFERKLWNISYLDSDW